MRFSLSSRASVASRASPSHGLAHGVKTSVVLSSEARRCLLRALSGFCSVVLTSRRSDVLMFRGFLSARSLTSCRSQISSGSFSLHKERCVELCCAASITNNRTTEQLSFEHVEFCAAFMSKSILVSHIFNESSSFAYTFIGYNLRFGHTHLKNVNISERFMQISRIICSIRRVFGVVSPFEDLLVNLSCS